VDVIDASGVVTSLGVGIGAAPSAVAISQDGTRAYVANTGSRTISVIDTGVETGTTPAVKDSFTVLGDQPSALVVTPGRDRLYVLTSSGVEVVDTQTGTSVPLDVAASGGQLAITRDGKLVFVASGNVFVIDTTDNRVVATFAPEKASVAGISNVAIGVAIAPDDAHAFVSVTSYISDSFRFSVSGGLAIVDRANIGTPNNPVTSTIDLFSQPGSIAFSADGDLAYVGIQSYWADTLYGAGFLPGRWVAAIDNRAEIPALSQWIDLGAGGAASPTPAGVAVSPDRSALFVSIPKNNSVIVIDPATNAFKASISVPGSPRSVAVVPNPTARPTPFVLHAADDIAANPVPAQHAAIAVANVLANDTLGGGQATTANVTLSVGTPTSAGLALDAATGAVWVTANAAVGSHTLTYRICDAGNADVCATASVSVAVRARYAIAAADDRATSLPGGIALTNVVANDTLGSEAASLANVSLIAVSSDAALSLSAGDGSVVVSADAARGDHVLTYRICELADPTNCSANGTATVTVVWRDISAGSDSASASKAGGTAIANVLANDSFDGGAATLARVTIASVSSPNAGVTLDPATGSVSVAAGTAAGPQTLVYRICERANSANCSADASVTVTVTGYAVNAVGDSARASSKNADFGVVNVLANDTIGGAPATLANVALSLVSVSPSNRQIRFNSDGTVDILGKSGGGTYSLRYQICDLADPANCGQATLSLNLSGK
jgi:YVTN family beta-propeller protein